MEVFGLSEAFSAPSLAKRCVLFALDKYEELCEAGGGPGIYPQVGSTGRREGVTRAYQERWGGGTCLCVRGKRGVGYPLYTPIAMGDKAMRPCPGCRACPMPQGCCQWAPAAMQQLLWHRALAAPGGFMALVKVVHGLLIPVYAPDTPVLPPPPSWPPHPIPTPAPLPPTRSWRACCPCSSPAWWRTCARSGPCRWTQTQQNQQQEGRQ